MWRERRIKEKFEEKAMGERGTKRAESEGWEGGGKGERMG